MGIEGRTALVTGGGKGIGKAIVKTFAKEKINIAFTYNRSKEKAEELLKELTQQGVEARAYYCDVSKLEEIDLVIETLLKDFGKLDILVNNVGTSKSIPFLEMSIEDWDEVFNVNLRSAFYFSSKCAKLMIKNHWGRIINIGSLGGEKLIPGVSAHYSSSKAGLSGLTRVMAKELARYEILVNCVAPGLITTDMSDYMNGSRVELFKRFHPLRRLGKPEEVADLVSFLASDKSGYITGETLIVSGGLI